MDKLTIKKSISPKVVDQIDIGGYPVPERTSPRKSLSPRKPSSPRKQTIRPAKSNFNILFACTNLSKQSTFVSYYDKIQKTIFKFFPEYQNIEKNLYFAYKVPSEQDLTVISDITGMNIVQNNRYRLVQQLQDQTLIDFILSNPNTKFDILVLAQCSSLVDTIMYQQNDFEKKDLLFRNVILFYNAIKPNGLVINFFYFMKRDAKKIGLENPEAAKKYIQEYNLYRESRNYFEPFLNDFDRFFNVSTLLSMEIFIFLFKVLKKLFKRRSEGVYQKLDLSEEQVYQILEKEYNSTLKEIMGLIDQYGGNPDLFVEALETKYFPTYFTGKEISSVKNYLNLKKK